MRLGGGEDRPDIAKAIASVWDEWTHVAASNRVLQTGDLAANLGRNLNVLRRRPDGVWKLAIAVLRNPREGEEND